MRKQMKKPSVTGGTESQRQRLEAARLKPVGLLEALRMRRLGRQDGRAGLPRQTTGEGWDSPVLYQEFSAYSEFCDREWGATQLDLQDDYAAVGTLLDTIRRREADLARLVQDPPAAEEPSCQRLPGEEALSDAQIKTRRSREAQRQNAPYLAKIQALRQELQAACGELSRRQGRITEVNNGARLICQRVQKHTEQRRAIYWSAVLRTHPAKASLPAAPEALPQSEAELTYLSQHRSLEEEAIAMLARRARLQARQASEEPSFPTLLAHKKGAASA